MLKSVGLWGIVVLLVLMTGGVALTDEIISFDQTNPPFMFQKNGHVQGLYPAIIAEAFRRMGVGVRLQALPWPRALLGADAGIWGVGGLYMTEERLWKYDYSEPIFEERLMLYVLRGREFPFSGIGDLTGKRIGVMRGWSYGDEFDQAVVEGKIIADPVASDQANIGRLLLRRVDAIVAAPETWAVSRESLDPQGLAVALPEPVARNRTYLCFPKSKGLTSLLDRFNAEVRGMRQDGALDRFVHENFR